VVKLIIFIVAFLIIYAGDQPEIRAFHLSGNAQGTTFNITYYATDSVFTLREADSVLNKIDSSLSLYKPYSLINTFNTSDSGVVMDVHLQQVVKRSLQVYEKTHRAFDITVWPLVTAWGFGLKKIEDIPDSATIAKLMPCIGSNKLAADGNHLTKKIPCVQIDVNGIAQGYTVDVLAAFMESKGLTNYLVELGGEIRVRGRKQPGNQQMKIGIESPGDDPFLPPVIKKIITIDSGAITTSGSYRKFYESNGKRFPHIIDPATGFTIQNELISVTVFAKDAITADAYDNALMVMGLHKALRFASVSKEIEAMFIYHNGKGLISDTATAGFYTIMQN
jgi:thiamine biosynthesis lipoprotein